MCKQNPYFPSFGQELVGVSTPLAAGLQTLPVANHSFRAAVCLHASTG